MVVYSSKDFDIKKLGSFYSKDKTIFRVFAPESKKVSLIINDTKYDMHKNGYCFEIALSGDLELYQYYYQNDVGIKYRDPFAYYSDEECSYILDTNKFVNEVFTPSKLRDIIIYETNVRDFSCHDSYPGKYRKKFLALQEAGLKIGENPIGLDYVKGLGVTHIQLMPVFSYDSDYSDYNWGYNPLAYNYVHSDYVNDDSNPYAYVNELRYVVNRIHENDIRVTLDVVFNHVYKANDYDLEKMIPGHIFRKTDECKFADGTYCGNEINSEDVFVRAYIVEMCTRYLRLFDIDGMRFDLMGILDCDTINLVNVECKKIKRDFIVYGEGWNMGETLAEENRAAIINASKIPGIAMFNDYFRDTIIKYVCGNDSIRDDVKNVIGGTGIYMKYDQSINYVECHDNYTFFDRLIRYKNEDPIWLNINRCKLALALVMLSRGVSFIHAGQEFLRTKNLIDNSYNSGESINKIDWNRMIENKGISDYLRDLIEIRRNNNGFISTNADVRFEDYYDCLIYYLNDLMIIINPSKWDYTHSDSGTYKVIFDINGKNDYETDFLSIPACSAIVVKR